MISRHCLCIAAVVSMLPLVGALAAPGASPSPAAAPVAQKTERNYRIEVESDIKEKAYKFFVTSDPVKTTVAVEFKIKPGAENDEISVLSMDYTWKTTGLDLHKIITPEQVVYNDNGNEQVQWTPGQKKKNEVNPLEVFGKPIGFLTAGGRDVGVITRSPDKYIRFSENFALGKVYLLHRPPLPAGDLKQGQTFTTDVDMVDPSYSAIAWAVPVEWTVESISGSGDDAVVQLGGTGAATKDKSDSRMGIMTDGTVTFTSTVKMKMKSAELISGDSRIAVRWKRDPANSPSGIMDYTAEGRVRESVLGSK